MVEDLWPEKLELTKIRPPATILKEQGSLLGKKTKNIVEGRVSDAQLQDEDEKQGSLEYTFSLVAPALNNYHYRLFTMRHDIRLYPVRVFIDKETLVDVDYERYQKYAKVNISRFSIAANNEADFLELLKKIFAAKKTTQIIASMLAQATT